MEPEVYIVGDGSSLCGFDFNRLLGLDVIAINQAIFYVSPLANKRHFITMDQTWPQKNNLYDTHSLRGQTFRQPDIDRWFVFGHSQPRIIQKGEMLFRDTVDGTEYNLDLFDHVLFPTGGYGGLCTDFTDFRVGSDSGFAAIQLAVALGYTKINLLGMDFHLSHYRKAHFHEDYPVSTIGFQQKLDEYLIPYPEMLGQAIARNIQIISRSSISRLNGWIHYFPFIG